MERIEKRADDLHALGLKFNGQEYHGVGNLVDLNVHHVEMTTMDDDEWAEMLADLKKVISERGPQSLPTVELPALIGTIEDVPAGTIKNALVKLNVTDVALAKVRGTVMDAVQKYDGSKASYEAVKRARLDVVPLRTSVKKEAEVGRAEAIAVQKLWIGAEKTVTGFYANLEALCATKEEEYETARRKEAEEIAVKEKARVDALIAQLTAYEWQGNPFEVAQDTPVQFAERLSKAQDSFRLIEAGRKAGADRKVKEEQESRELAEANRLEAQRLDDIRMKQEALAAKLEADRQDFERQQREAREATDKAERERLAKVAEDERKAREAAEAETNRLQALADAKAKEESDAKAAEAERLRLAALAPDIDKVWAWAHDVWEVAQKIPSNLADQSMTKKVSEASKSIDEILTHLRLSSKS